MNIEQAKKVPLALILEKIGCPAALDKNHQSSYLSPLRHERTPSFQINHAKNVWYDFGTGQGGSVIEFVIAYLDSCNESCTVADALRWTANMSGILPAIKAVPVADFSKEDSRLVLKSAKPIKHPALINYLKSRGIAQNIATAYLEEVLIHNRDSKKDFFALGLVNEDGGYDVRNPFFKGCVGSKDISFIRGTQPKPGGIHIFEGVMDYLSAVTLKKVQQFHDDTIILNSLSCLKQATPYIRNYGYNTAYTWLDNDIAGQKGTQALAAFFKTEENLQHKPMNDTYLPHKDVNAWLMAQL